MLATAESRNQAVSKLESLIERGRSRAANVIDHVSAISRPLPGHRGRGRRSSNGKEECHLESLG